MKLSVAYCRVSTDKKEQELSIKEQKKQWLEFFSEKQVKAAKCGLLYKKDGTKDFITNGIYADEGISGTSLRNRRAFNQMLEDASHKRFDMIFVEDISRFSRSAEDGIKIIKDLRELGIGVYFRKEGWDTLSDRHDFEFGLRIQIAQEESRIKSERLKWAMNRLHKKGGWNGAAPFGFDVKNAFLKINDEEAEIVKLIYDLFTNQGYGVSKIARYLNGNNIPTKTGVKWSQTQVTSILGNKLYNGEQRQHTIESADINRHLQIEIPEDEHIVFNYDHLKIIDDETFTLTQLERKKRNEQFSNGTGHSNKHLLSTLIYCGHCGATYKRKKRHAYKRIDGTSKDLGYEWTCGINDMYGKDRCGHRNMLIEEDIIQAIKNELEIRKNVDLTDMLTAYCEKTFNNNVDIEALRDMKEKFTKEMRQLRKDKADDLIDDDLYKEELKELSKQIKNIGAEISRYERRAEEIEMTKLKFNKYKTMIQSLDLDNLTNTDLKKVFRKILVKEKIVNGNKEIYLSFRYNFLDITEEEIFRVNEEEYCDFLVKVG